MGGLRESAMERGFLLGFETVYMRSELGGVAFGIMGMISDLG